MKEILFPVQKDTNLFLGAVPRAFWTLRAPMVVALVAAFTLQADQMKELLYLFAEEGFDAKYQILLAIVFFSAFCVVLWLLGRSLLSLSGYQKLFPSRLAAGLRAFFTAFVALVPVVGLLFAVSSAQDPLPERKVGTDFVKSLSRVNQGVQKAYKGKTEFDAARAALAGALGEIEKPSNRLQQVWYILLGILVLSALAGTAHAFMSPAGQASFEDYDELVPGILRSPWLWVTAFAAFLVLFSLPTVLGPISTRITQWMGTLAVIFSALMFFAVFLSLLTRLYDSRGIPAISILLAVALVASYFDTNNNHAVRLIDRVASSSSATSTQAGPDPLSVIFKNWLEKKRDDPSGYWQKYTNGGRKFLVYLFAVQGGGQYSSTLASLTLAKLYDRCPALRHHTFIISGVSGGSMGAGLFGAQLKAELQNKNQAVLSDRCDFDLASGSLDGKGHLEDKISKIQLSDFLSPILASGLYGDFLQRFIPWPPIPAFDRERAFEAGVENTWRRHNPDYSNQRPLEEDFLSYWSADSDLPLLLFNTTRVQTGEPIAVAPFLTRTDAAPNGGEIRSIFPIALDKNKSIRLSTAMGLSSRFPLISPIGRVERSNQKRPNVFDLVDGGYFENSGAEAIRLLMNELAFYVNYPHLIDPSGKLKPLLDKIEFRVVVLNEYDRDDLDGQELNEVVSPVLAVYRARKQRGLIAVNTIYSRVETAIIRLSHDPIPLPLGWHLSKPKQDLISSMIGTPDQCATDNAVSIANERRAVIKDYAAQFAAEGNAEIDKAQGWSNRIGHLFGIMYSNRCKLRRIILDINPAAGGGRGS